MSYVNVLLIQIIASNKSLIENYEREWEQISVSRQLMIRSCKGEGRLREWKKEREYSKWDVTKKEESERTKEIGCPGKEKVRKTSLTKIETLE